MVCENDNRSILQNTQDSEKCVFEVTSIKFLRHMLWQNGLQVDPEKVVASLNLKAPTNKKALQRLVR